MHLIYLYKIYKMVGVGVAIALAYLMQLLFNKTELKILFSFNTRSLLHCVFDCLLFLNLNFQIFLMILNNVNYFTYLVKIFKKEKI